MKSFDDEANKRKQRDETIPDVPGAPKGLRGIKAPFGRSQHDDILDRMQASGAIRKYGPELNKN